MLSNTKSDLFINTQYMSKLYDKLDKYFKLSNTKPNLFSNTPHMSIFYDNLDTF